MRVSLPSLKVHLENGMPCQRFWERMASIRIKSVLQVGHMSYSERFIIEKEQENALPPVIFFIKPFTSSL